MKLLLTSTLEHFGPKLPLVFGETLKDMNVLCISTAAYAQFNYAEWLPAEINGVRQHVQALKEFDIKEKKYSQLEDELKDIDILYVTGGNTYCLLEAMQDINFKNILSDFFKKGGLYFGSSAGAAVTSPSIDFIGDMDDVSLSNLKNYEGLNLIDFFFMPHIDHASYGPKAKACIEKLQKENKKIIGLKDDQAIWIEDNYMRFY